MVSRSSDSERKQTSQSKIQKLQEDSRQDWRKIQKKRRSRYTAVFLLLFLGVAAVTVISVNTGNMRISLGELVRAVFLKQGRVDVLNILWTIRLPRILTGMLLGGAISLSGFLLQTFFENPIAGPFVLGISSGSKMAVAIVMILLMDHVSSMGSGVLVIAAFAGALAATGLVLLFSQWIRNAAALLLAGIMIGYICSAVTDFLTTFAKDSDVVNLHGWSMGSFSGMSWQDVRVSGMIVLAASFLTFLLSKPIGAYQLGEAYAASMGVNIRRFRAEIIILSSLLSGCVTAFAGPISFVGIAVPFLAKRMLGTSRPILVIPASFLTGSLFCMICDLIARTAFAPTELNISTVTSIFGAPIVLYIMLQRRRMRHA
ncbi:MAG: iron ABC transporter permease [Eubacterium sp.]|jgi:iron complex transport system permease protein|nr:iron ABC transporter permease [Eubacterium sp.]MCI1428039.1 iron ABC transporter permease [Eubacterium sp.]MCI1475982.1 iron ABC transporter permease [Eubacterium sp.]